MQLVASFSELPRPMGKRFSDLAKRSLTNRNPVGVRHTHAGMHLPIAFHHSPLTIGPLPSLSRTPISLPIEIAVRGRFQDLKNRRELRSSKDSERPNRRRYPIGQVEVKSIATRKLSIKPLPRYSVAVPPLSPFSGRKIRDGTREIVVS